MSVDERQRLGVAMSQSLALPSPGRAMAMVLWPRRPQRSSEEATSLPPIATTASSEAVRSSSTALDHIQKLINDCSVKLGNPNLKPIRIVVDSFGNLQKWCEVIKDSQIVKCKLTGSTTVLRTHSKHGRFIVHETEDTIVKCAFGTAVSASALVSFMSRASATIYEVAISDTRVVAMIKSSISTIKKTKGDNADLRCWRISVGVRSAQIDVGPPPSQGDVEPQQRTRIDLTFASTPDDTVEYTPLITELLVDVNAHPINRSMTSDGGGATGSRRSWSQAFEDESSNMIVMKRRENTGGRKKKRDSGDSIVNDYVTPVPLNPVTVVQSHSLESILVPEDENNHAPQEELTTAAANLLHLIGAAPLIVWINSTVSVQRNILPDALLFQLGSRGDDGRPCDLSCIFMGWKAREFFRWFDRIEGMVSNRLDVSISSAAYWKEDADAHATASDRFELAFLVSICTGNDSGFGRRMCGALDSRQFLSINKLVQEFQQQRIRVVANELPSVTHVIVSGAGTASSTAESHSPMITKNILCEIVGASSASRDTVDVINVE